MKKGDHLRVNMGFYHHHGLDMGDGNVIHYGRGLHDLENACVEVVCKEIFANEKEISVVPSECNFDPDTVIERALSRLGESGYDLFDNNCEHFVNWCRSEKNSSPQVEQSETLLRQGTAAAVKPVLSRLVVRKGLAKTGFKSLLKSSTRMTGAALIGDAAQAAVELCVSANGSDQKTVRALGNTTGAVTSVTLGTVLGGPIGGATTLGIWLAGQVIADQVFEGGKKVLASTLQT